MDVVRPIDQLCTHVRMLADLDGSRVYWLLFAQIYAELPGRPVMLLGRFQACTIMRVEWQRSGVAKIAHKEAGLYLSGDGDELLEESKIP